MSKNSVQPASSQTDVRRSRKKHILELTDLEILALVDILDTFSSVKESFDDDGTATKDLKKVDKMLNKNGYKRQYT